MNATGPPGGLSLNEAYRRCEAITRTEAKNFYYGIRLLPSTQRRAICAAYAFARRVDDIGDGELSTAQKLSRLEQAGAELEAVESAAPAAPSRSDPVLVALADAYRAFSLPRGALGELIDGVRMDVNGVRYERFEDLVLYCRRVAGAIGRVCLAVFAGPGGPAGSRAEAELLADDLGVALQLTNILRDVREDAENGRVYLPAEDLRRFGLITRATPDGAEQLLAALGDDSLQQLVRFEAERAQAWFERGMQLAPLLNRRSGACVLAMAGIYRRLLARIATDPRSALRERASLPVYEKTWVAISSMLGGRRTIGRAA